MASDMSPAKKKMKIMETVNPLKRGIETESNLKRLKAQTSKVEDKQAMKRKNFVTACEQVSYKAYFDYSTRLQLVYLPTCLDVSVCKHQDNKRATIKEMANYAEEAVKIETKTNMWCEALEVCFMCVTPDQYLSANVLKEIVEIMMNAHEDIYGGYTIPYLIDKCQQILAQNFSTHPPCLSKTLRKCYNNFLTSPLELKDKTFTNRTEFEHDKGIVKYCMNRLEYEISTRSKNEALIDKYEHIPEEMKDSVKGLHWQKEKFEIFELLKRPERIERLMAVLESLIELLQFDLAIWQNRYTNNLGCHIMRTHKPLMAYILWSNNVLYTGAVNKNCRQIFRLFMQLIHLRYPEEHIRIMTTWINVITQTFYICETNSNSDYPNTSKYCASFAKEFYKIMAEMPHETIIKILERIQPTFMQTLIGTRHIKMLLSTQEDDILKIFIEFLKKTQWKMFPECNNVIQISKSFLVKPKKVDILKYLMTKCQIAAEDESIAEDISEIKCLYPKFDPLSFSIDSEIDQNYVVHVLYISIEAYLDAYNVNAVQETLDKLNEQLQEERDVNHHRALPELSSYSVTEHFIKKYRTIYQLLKELILILSNLMKSGELPCNLKIFEKIGLLELCEG